MERVNDRVPEWLDREAYPFEHRWFVLEGGARMHYVDKGKGETMLFVHGTPTWSFEWRHLIRAFASTHRCVAPDLVGFGLSDRPRDFAYTPEAHARALVALVEGIDLRDVILVVHDFGRPIALPLALQEARRVRRVVVLNSWMWSFSGDAAMERAAKIAGGTVGRALYRWANFSLRVIMPSAYGDRATLTPAIHRQYLSVFPGRWSRGTVLWTLARELSASATYYERLWSMRNRLRELPVLVVWGMPTRPSRRTSWRGGRRRCHRRASWSARSGTGRTRKIRKGSLRRYEGSWGRTSWPDATPSAGP